MVKALVLNCRGIEDKPFLYLWGNFLKRNMPVDTQPQLTRDSHALTLNAPLPLVTFSKVFKSWAQGAHGVSITFALLGESGL